MEVPGRAGAMLVSGHIPVADVTVRLFLDAGYKMRAEDLADARHKLAFWLCVPGGGELALPDEPGRVYHDALLVDAGKWKNLFSDGQCDVTFALFDPVAYGMERIERMASFEVGGTWATWPEFRLVAEKGSSLRVSLPSAGRYLEVGYGFVGGEAVVIDCEHETVEIGGSDARDCVTLGSDFFRLDPGACTLVVSGCSYFEVRFVERWL